MCELITSFNGPGIIYINACTVGKLRIKSRIYLAIFYNKYSFIARRIYF